MKRNDERRRADSLIDDNDADGHRDVRDSSHDAGSTAEIDVKASGSGRGKASSAVRDFRREASVLGGVRSMANTAKEGGETIALGVRTLATATRESLKPGRFETFAQAMKRLGVAHHDLPIIHNQIVLQCYLTLFVAVLAGASALAFAFKGQLLAPLIAVTIGATCLVKAAQSSIQCFSIQERELGLNSQWISRPDVWIPKRIHAIVDMHKDDPLRHPSVIEPIARAARKNLIGGAAMILLAVVWSLVFPGSQWSLLYVGIGMVFILFGSKHSFEVYKRRRGVHCDAFPWLTDPSAWFPDLRAEAVRSPKSPEFTRSDKSTKNKE